MSLEDFLILITKNPLPIILIFAAIPALSFLVSLLHKKGEAREKPWKYIYSLLVYLAAVPGMFSLVITLYSVIFQKANLLALNISIHFLPVISMVITLLIIKRVVSFNDVPGFDKLLGLLLLIAVSFIIGILLSRIQIWILFRGSMISIVVLSIIIFLLFRWGLKLIKGRKQGDAP